MRPFVSKTNKTRKSKSAQTSESRSPLVLTILKASLRALGKTTIWTVKTPWALASMMIAVACVWAIAKDVPQAMYFYAEKQLAQLAISADVQLKNVYLEGQEHTNTEDILQVMDVKIGAPLFSVEIQEIRTNLEALPWVRYAEVERQYPSTLTVRIVERIPVALWQFDQQLQLLDSEGEVIRAENISSFSDYLILVGKDAPYHLPEVMQMLESQKSLKPFVSSFIRVSERRWDVILRNDIRIMLPEQQPEKMWDYLAQLQEEKHMLDDNSIESINLKIPEKIFIERKSGQEASLSGGART